MTGDDGHEPPLMPRIRIDNIRRVNAGSLFAIFELRLVGICYSPQVKFFFKGPENRWLSVSAKDGIGSEYLKLALFDPQITAAIIETVEFELDLPATPRDLSRLRAAPSVDRNVLSDRRTSDSPGLDDRSAW